MANFHHCKVHYIWASLYNGNLDVCISEVLTQLMFTVFCTLEFEVTLNETVGYRIFAIFFIFPYIVLEGKIDFFYFAEKTIKVEHIFVPTTVMTCRT